ncbi:hypothetical protein ACFQ0B_68945 [Nonomuraea thailandensis]
MRMAALAGRCTLDSLEERVSELAGIGVTAELVLLHPDDGIADVAAAARYLREVVPAWRRTRTCGGRCRPNPRACPASPSTTGCGWRTWWPRRIPATIRCPSPSRPIRRCCGGAGSRTAA